MPSTTNFVQRIYDFNRDAGLLDKPYDDFLETSFQIEEALEGFSNLPHLAKQVLVEDAVTGYDAYTPKEVARAIVALARTDDEVPEILPDVARLDKHIDSMVFDIGALAKLGLTPEQMIRAINVVMDANQAKLGCPKDSHGKLTKPADFPNPEPRLQAILDER